MSAPQARLPRLCHVIPGFGGGGVLVRLVTLINALGPRFSHTVVALNGRYGGAAQLDGRAIVELRSPPVHRGDVRSVWEFYRAFKETAPDLLITYNWGAIFGLIGGQLYRRCPIIHTEAGFGPGEEGGPKLRRLLARRLLLRRVFRVVVPSRVLVKAMSGEHGVPSEKLLRIPEGVDVARFRPRRDLAWRRARGIPDDCLLVGTVCSLRPVKNLGLLLRAFARAELPRARLAIVGDGTERAAWEALAARLGIAERVTFAGRVDDPAPCYAAFDLFAMSSRSEQTPFALLEAMASGLPAICTDVGDCREMLGGVEPAIVPPDDEASYAAALATLAARVALRAALGADNRARCVEHYSAERMVRAYAELFDAALDSAR